MPYEIKNISRYLLLAGLYPGKTKKVQNIDDNMKELYNKQLLSITEIKEEKVKEPLKKENIDCEVV